MTLFAKRIMIVLVLIFASSQIYALQDEYTQKVEEGGIEDLYLEQGMVNGEFWNNMSNQDKFSYLLGYQDGLMATTAHFVSGEAEKTKAMSSFPKGVFNQLIPQIDEFYAEEKNMDIPISYVLTIIRNRQKGTDETKIQNYTEYLRDSQGKDLRKSIEGEQE
ncbi:MAG: hypothetical protein NG740_00975 [Omnitrophica bacterium]|nr:hypothetical protein [Candidatus Omnitrophota bacterium]